MGLNDAAGIDFIALRGQLLYNVDGLYGVFLGVSVLFVKGNGGVRTRTEIVDTVEMRVIKTGELFGEDLNRKELEL
jgi:hypothetical protein